MLFVIPLPFYRVTEHIIDDGSMGHDGPMGQDGSMGQWVKMGQWVNGSMGHDRLTILG